MDKLKEILKRKEELRTKAQEDGADLDAIQKELDELKQEERKAIAEIETKEKRSAILKEISEGSAVITEQRKLDDKFVFSENSIYDSSEYRSAFFKRLAGVQLSETEQRAMSTASNSAGVAVPTTTMNKILEKVQQDSIVYSLVSVSHLRGNVVIPIEGTTNNVERKGEGEDGTIQEDTLGSLELGAKKYIKLVKLTCELEATSIAALEDYIVRKLAKKLTQAFDEDIINGTGVKGAKGVLATITPIKTAAEDTLDYDDVCELFAALSATAKKNATLMMSTNTLYKKIRKIKDSNKNPIFDTNSNKVMGREVTECDVVPDDVIIFGDFSEYQFNWNKDIEITKSGEAAFASGDTVFRGLALADGGLADLGAMKALKVKNDVA